MQKSDSFDLLFDFNKDYYKKKLKRLKDLIKTKIDEEKLDITYIYLIPVLDWKYKETMKIFFT